MQKQQHTIHIMQSPMVASRETSTIEQKLGQLQAQLRQMPRRTSADYGFSLSVTRRFAQEVVAELVSWLKETEAPATGKGRRP